MTLGFGSFRDTNMAVATALRGPDAVLYIVKEPGDNRLDVGGTLKAIFTARIRGMVGSTYGDIREAGELSAYRLDDIVDIVKWVKTTSSYTETFGNAYGHYLGHITEALGAIRQEHQDGSIQNEAELLEALAIQIRYLNLDGVILAAAKVKEFEEDARRANEEEEEDLSCPECGSDYCSGECQNEDDDDLDP